MMYWAPAYLQFLGRMCAIYGKLVLSRVLMYVKSVLRAFITEHLLLYTILQVLCTLYDFSSVRVCVLPHTSCCRYSSGV